MLQACGASGREAVRDRVEAVRGNGYCGCGIFVLQHCELR
jgi:hypothetical protein